MAKLLKKSIFLCFISAVLFFPSFSYADTPDSFSIDVKQTFNVGEAVDFSVIAIKNGEQLKEYTGTIIFSILDSNGNFLDGDFYKLPNHGFYDFIDTDQGKKTFSKGLQITKAGTYTFEIDDLFQGGIAGKTVVTVLGDDGNKNTELINISYPGNGVTETKSYVNMIGSCANLKNSPVMVYLNDKIINSGYTDSKGEFNVLVSDLLSGDNNIQAKIIDINGVVLGESPNILVKYQPPQDGIFNSIEILPSRTGKQGDKIIFNVNTDDGVSSAQLLFSNGLKYSMDRIGQGLFSKELLVTFFGNIDISLSLIENSNEKIYENIDMIYIKENIAISNIKFTTTGSDGSQVIVTRETLGSVPRYKIDYGTEKNNLNNSISVSSSTVLIDNIKKDTSYFFQIIPMDNESHNSGDPSEIVEYHSSALSCVVKGIKIRQEQIGDNYYLVRDPVENAISYEVYKSDWADMTDSRLVGNLTGTRFQYIFDSNAKKDEYAYYQVQAICPDGTNIIVDNAQKVKVGPMENILLILLISFFVYSIYKLHRLSEE